MNRVFCVENNFGIKCNRRLYQSEIIKIILYKNYFIVMCPKCRLTVCLDEARPTEEQAIELWNDRMRYHISKLEQQLALLERGW